MSKLRNFWFLIVLNSIAVAVIVYQHFVLHKQYAGLWDVFSLLFCAFGLFLCGTDFIRRGRLVRIGYGSLIMSGCACMMAGLAFIMSL
ncbi:MAG: hypothetical protein WCC10_14215 [Tumebacillaceae bacterium]